MAKVVSIQKNQSSFLNPVRTQSLSPVKSESAPDSPFTQTVFTDAYGNKTNLVMLELLDKLYKHYKQSQEFEYLSFGQKVDLEFKYEVLRRIIQTLKK